MIDNIIIPMAGLGQRFKKNNFSTIKPLILIENTTILENSIKELPLAKRKYCILKKDIFDKYSLIKKILNKNKISPYLLSADTLGQSDTCYKIINYINPKEDLFIHSCDYVMKYSYKKFIKQTIGADVIIFTYKLKSTIVKNYNDYAYCLEHNGIVKKIVEKKTVSQNPSEDHMIVGSFWFKNSKDFFDMHDIALKKGLYVNKELYVANNINILIKQKKKVKIFEVDHWKNLGDVFSYKQYIYWNNYFKKNDKT
jgi:bifunctional N-acetylglucosamine-1-phosphate-uridyltransferase/glucosamine-1-phosphate-acetyltransferase GlmU-like protein